MITISERASQELKELMNSQDATDSALRVWVAGGGCSGLSYGMALDGEKAESEDQVFQISGLNVYIDNMSLQYMEGAVIDFIDDDMGGGFKIENPNATKTCGCGSSFSAENAPESQNQGGCCGSSGGCCG